MDACAHGKEQVSFKMPYGIKTLHTEEVFNLMSLYAHGKDIRI
jgi:hypothetical protein